VKCVSISGHTEQRKGADPPLKAQGNLALIVYGSKV